jgi:hypothetical protein
MTQNRAASKNLETQGCGLFVALERWIDSALEFTQEIETKDGRKADIRYPFGQTHGGLAAVSLGRWDGS